MSRLALITVITVAGASLLSGCGHAAKNAITEAQPTRTTQTGPDQNPFPSSGSPANQSEQPISPGIVQPDGSVSYDQPGDRNVTINAPFNNTKVDQDTGSIHVDAPFVHIDKAGRGQKMHINIGGASDDGSR